MRFTAVDVDPPGWSGFLHSHDRHGMPPMRKNPILGFFNPLLRVCLNKQVSLLREWMVGIVGIRLFPENRHLAYFQGVYMKL